MQYAESVDTAVNVGGLENSLTHQKSVGGDLTTKRPIRTNSPHPERLQLRVKPGTIFALRQQYLLPLHQLCSVLKCTFSVTFLAFFVLSWKLQLDLMAVTLIPAHFQIIFT